ncbi:MAG: hypothetical protein ABI782_08595 [Anaerolineaceae bacterium]
MKPSSTDIPLTMVSASPRPPLHAPVMRQPWSFAAFMSGSALLAVVAGLALGILAALELWIGGDRWTQSVQAHGRLQLFGFVATFIVAVAFEFLPRLNQRPAFSRRVRVGVPAILATSSVVLAAGQVCHQELPYLILPAGLTFTVGSLLFAIVVWRVRAPFPFRRDPQPLFLRVAASWFVVAAALSVWAFAAGDSGVVAPANSRMVIETFLRGFVMLTITGIGLRAFAGHLGLTQLTARRQKVVLAVLNASLMLWLAAQGAGSLPRFEILIRIADVGYAAAILLLTAWLGVLSPLRRRRGSRYELLIPLAWAGLVVYAVMLAVAAVFYGQNGLSLYQEGAIRHTFLLGFVLPLMVGMAHIVLARFGTGVVLWENALTGSFALLLAAWPLRVLPALGRAPSDAGQALLATAGFVAMAGLILLAAVSARTALAVAGRRPRT